MTGRWVDRAVCSTEANPEMFFPDPGDNGNLAKEVCRSCPVRLECLRYALQHPGLHGVWGGTSFEERKSMRRRVA